MKTEYDTGINEYTLSQNEVYSLKQVFEELESMIENDMVISVVVPRAKRSAILQLSNCKNELLRKKIEKALNRKKK